MLRIERQEKIKEWIAQKKNMTIKELSKHLGVSEMTVHRDLKPLIEEGTIIKTFGGITYRGDAALDAPSPKEECVYCRKKVNESFAFRLILSENRIEAACCAHCGLLRYQQLDRDVLQAICYDFLRKTTISVPLTWFVMDASLDLGCCQPQVLTFEYKKHAEQFVKGFGGKVFSFEEILIELPKKMHLKKAHHCQE
ncbi:DeoR family transcriptional regulator [Tuberibacillus calidus]|uniref:DeoR family transcriptional regulator n=1 Tax=Tuberibacillus calidus TaxID=340097 RepID=UPI000400F4D5|nr:DeoR family transcriptional regulator [Tuberibacillus calidus]